MTPDNGLDSSEKDEGPSGLPPNKFDRMGMKQNKKLGSLRDGPAIRIKNMSSIFENSANRDKIGR